MNNTNTKVRALATAVTLAVVLGIAQYLSKTFAAYPGGQGPYPLPPGGVVTNITILTNINIFAATNVTIFDSLTVNTNVTVNQNLTVKGNASFSTVIITNASLFSTNAFPLAAGTTWNLSKNYQRMITNNDWAITALGGLSNNLLNWGCLWWSNSDSATHFLDMTELAVTPQGPNTTNKLYIASGKTATISIASWGVSVETNLVTAAEQ